MLDRRTRELLSTAAKLSFEPHRISLDRTGHYEEPFDREFPFVIKLFHFRSRRYTPGLTWHERLELFIPLDGPARQRMGEQEVELGARELLVVDNLKLHSVVDFPGFDTRVVVISFLPEFIYSLGSPSHDYTFLLPFYSKSGNQTHVVRTGSLLLPEMHGALAKLLACYFNANERQYFQAGCKAFFMELLYLLAREFRSSELLKSEFLRQQERSQKLKTVFDYVTKNHTERISLAAAARMAGLSQPQFMRLFKKVAGMTWVAYVTHVRLATALRLLRETELSIAEVASQAGFTDQSYFDRRFKAAFGHPPSVVRSRKTAV